MPTNNHLSIEDFGKHLLETNELDPVYVALHGAGMEPGQLRRWLVAYWCYYHCGVASHLSEFPGAAFWERMMVAARNEEPSPTGERWTRCPERRHFRGHQATRAVGELAARYPDHPEAMVDFIAGEGPTRPFADVARRVKEHRGFGDWIAFKVGDMLDRCVGVPVDFDHAAVFMFKAPAQAAEMVWREKCGVAASARPKNRDAIIGEVVAYLERTFAHYTAPPLHDRPVGLQEVETILCCWKSHVNGKYPPFNDIDEINEGLAPWVELSSTAAALAEAMPKRP